MTNVKAPLTKEAHSTSARSTKPAACSLQPRAKGRQPTARRGLTIIELLVVIGILLAITTTVIGVVASNGEDRMMREATRQVTSSLEAAKARAVASGRQVALVIEPLNNVDNEGRSVGTRLSFAEVPPPYAGDFLEATIRLTVYGGLENSAGNFKDSSGNYLIPAGVLSLSGTYGGSNYSAGPSWGNLVSSGDLIQFNYQGPFFTIDKGDVQYVDSDGNTQTANDAWCVRWPSNVTPKIAPTSTMAFRVVRQPQNASSAAEVVTLPPQVCIDLAYSGIGQTGYGLPANGGFVYQGKPISLIFSSGGTLQGVQYGGGPVSATDAVYLLVGKRQAIDPNNLTDPTGLTDSNLKDLTSRWVAIHPQTALITAAINEPVTEGDTIAKMLSDARASATRAQGMGGR